MCTSKLHKALLTVTEAVRSLDQTNVDAMFDALVNLEFISQSTVEGHLIATSLQPEWKAVAQGDIVYH